MYGKQRFLTQNNITEYAGTIATSSQASGRITSITTTATGSALWESSGQYTGSSDILVTVQIDDVSAGKSVGQATFSWKKSTTGSGWEATGVTTSATAISLGSDGLEIFWTAGTGNDFEDGDTGTFWAYASFGPEQMFDADPNTYWQSTGVSSETLTIDYGESLQDTVLVIAHHNLSANATVTLMRNTTNAWGSPAYSQALTVADPLVFYFNDTHQFTRLLLQDSGNTDGYLRIAEIYIGTYVELAAEWARAQWGSEIARTRKMVVNESETGRRNQRIWSVQRTFDLLFDALDNTDESTLQAVWESTVDLSTGIVSPLWIHYFSDEPEFMVLCHFLSEYTRSFRSYGLNRVSMRCEEVALIR